MVLTDLIGKGRNYFKTVGSFFFFFKLWSKSHIPINVIKGKTRDLGEKNSGVLVQIWE